MSWKKKKKIPFQTRRQIHNQYKSYNILKWNIITRKSIIEDAIDLLALNLKLGIQRLKKCQLQLKDKD